jgi:hypothetical protein
VDSRGQQVTLWLTTASGDQLSVELVGPKALATELHLELQSAIRPAELPNSSLEPSAVVWIDGPGELQTEIELWDTTGDLDSVVAEFVQAALPVASRLGFVAETLDPALASTEAPLVTGANAVGEATQLGFGNCKCQVKEYVCKTQLRCITGWGCWNVEVCRWVCVQEVCG